MTHLLQIHEPGQTPSPHEAEENFAIGIDLGTTHSVVAHAADGVASVLTLEDDSSLVPSVVSYASETPLVGKSALQQLALSPEHTISSIKRFMGSQKGPEHTNKTPTEISADILRHLKVQSETLLNRPVQKAVITVPAYFSEDARLATRQAAQLAGLEVLRLINEPTAAALAYGLDQKKKGTYLVYDLGGGTFDITILTLQEGIFHVLATGGDAALGGDDIDEALTKHFHPDFDSLPLQEKTILLKKCRDIKEFLSNNPDKNYQDNNLDLSQEAFQKLVDPLLEKTISLCHSTLRDSEKNIQDLEDIILVGGSTRLPYLQKRIEATFRKKPLCTLNPDEVVAMGAALQAEAITQGSSHLLLDVTPLSLGIETMGGLIEKIIPRNTTIPCAVAQEFTTYQDGQTALSVHVLQGERETVEHCRSLGQFTLTGIPPMPAGMARIRVTFTLDADGLLSVQAQEKTTGTQETFHVKQSYGLDEETILKTLKESYDHAEEDIEERLLKSTTVKANQISSIVHSALGKDGALLEDEEKSEIQSCLNTLAEALKSQNKDAIEKETKSLESATQTFAEKRISRAVKESLKGQKVS